MFKKCEHYSPEYFYTISSIYGIRASLVCVDFGPTINFADITSLISVEVIVAINILCVILVVFWLFFILLILVLLFV